MRKSLTLLVALLVALASAAQAALPEDAVRFPLMSDYELDATSFIYCRTLGPTGLVDEDPIAVGIPIKTGGSGTDVVAVTAGSNPFANVAIGDELLLPAYPGGAIQRRYVVTRADADNITINATAAIGVNPASSYTQYPTFAFRKRVCGSTATDGWFPVHGADMINVQLQIDQINTTTGIDYQIECKIDGTVAVGVIVIGPTTQTAVWRSGNIVTEPWDFCRLGLKMTSTDDGPDAGATAEKISAYVEIRR